MTDWERTLQRGVFVLMMSTAACRIYILPWLAFPLVIDVILNLLCFLGLAVSFMFLLASYMKPAPSHTFQSVVASYIMYHIMVPIIGRYYKYKFKKMTINPQKYQDELLMNILKANCCTDFSIDHDLDKIRSRDEFTKKFPLTRFSHYEKYVERVAKGEQNVMTKAKVFHLSISSGTTGKNKMYPLTNGDVMASLPYGFIVASELNALQCKLLNRYLCFRLSSHPRKSEGGINIGGLGAARSPYIPDDVIPIQCQKIFHEEPSYFVQAVFGLRDPYVQGYQGFSSDLTYSFFTYIEHNKDKLCRAIAAGHIDPMNDLDENIRAELNQLLTPDPERAREVLNHIEQGSEQLARRLWPMLMYALVCRGGGFAHTASILERTYLKDVRFSMGGHFGTEGIYGVSATSEEALQEIFTFFPGIVFLEFIKVQDMEKGNPKVHLLQELEVGEQYELVVTNIHGLYRNRFGDVIKVVGFTNNTPKYIFQYRTGQILNCSFDRTPEQTVYDALKETESQWDMAIESYTTVENVHLDSVTGKKSPKNHYVAFIELQGDQLLQEKHQDMLEKNLQKRQESYSDFRGMNNLGPIEIIQVSRGTFNGLRGVLVGQYQNQQFKLPRVLRKPEALEYLWKQRIVK